jgi:hypothetical protein
LMFWGRLEGTDFPVSFKLQRYMARANSGKCSWPDFVVSARVLSGMLAVIVAIVVSRGSLAYHI